MNFFLPSLSSNIKGSVSGRKELPTGEIRIGCDSVLTGSFHDANLLLNLPIHMHTSLVLNIEIIIITTIRILVIQGFLIGIV